MCDFEKNIKSAIHGAGYNLEIIVNWLISSNIKMS